MKENGGMKKQVLIVEDDQHLAKVYQTALQENELIVQICHNGEEAIEWLKENTVDLVLLDLILPKKDGFNVLKAVKEGPQTKVPVLVVSNIDNELEKQRALELGADAYFLKVDKSIEDLRTIIDTYLSES
jgi:DNA-binding response OmpR family regulator